MKRRYRMAPHAQVYMQGALILLGTCRRPAPHRAWGARAVKMAAKHIWRRIEENCPWLQPLAGLPHRPVKWLIHGGAA